MYCIVKTTSYPPKQGALVLRFGILKMSYLNIQSVYQIFRLKQSSSRLKISSNMFATIL